MFVQPRSVTSNRSYYFDVEKNDQKNFFENLGIWKNKLKQKEGGAGKLPFSYKFYFISKFRRALNLAEVVMC
jgi:hypothetical protein